MVGWADLISQGDSSRLEVSIAIIQGAALAIRVQRERLDELGRCRLLREVLEDFDRAVWIDLRRERV